MYSIVHESLSHGSHLNISFTARTPLCMRLLDVFLKNMDVSTISKYHQLIFKFVAIIYRYEMRCEMNIFIYMSNCYTFVIVCIYIVSIFSWGKESPTHENDKLNPQLPYKNVSNYSLFSLYSRNPVWIHREKHIFEYEFYFSVATYG